VTVLLATLAVSIAAALGQAAAPAPAQTPAAPAHVPSAEEREAAAQIAELQQSVAAAMLREGVPGAALVLVNGKGIVWAGGFGDSDPSRGRQATPGTPFAAAAISPVIVGLVAARYAALHTEEKKAQETPLSPLDAPLDDAALSLSNPFNSVHRLTLATLLEQTAGLEDLAPEELLPSATMTPLLADVLRLRPHPSRWSPGARFSPSRVGIAAAASQLERWTKRPFFTLADAELFKPLAMNATTLRPELNTLDAMAVGRSGGRALPWNAPLYWPAQGLVTTAEDLGSLLAMIVAGGTAQTGPAKGQALLAPGILERVRRGRSMGQDVLDAPGLGTRIGFSDGHEQVGQAGVFEGNASALVWFPKEQAGYAVLLNAASPEALDEISAAARHLLLRDLPHEPLPPSPQTFDDLARASGVWRLASVRLEPLRFFDELFSFLVLRAGSDHELLVVPTLGEPRALLPMGRGAFRGSTDPRASMGLVARPGEEELLAPEGTFTRASWVGTYGRLGLVLAALFALGSSLLFALVWIPRALFGALQDSPDLRLRAAPAAAAFMLVLLLVLLGFSGQPLGAPNLTSVLVCALTLIFPALSLAALLECVRGSPGVGHFRSARAVRAHAFAVSLLACALSLELVLHGLAGIRTWAI
jgi:CubicO group peptidase (beta-lactamase class C family)